MFLLGGDSIAVGLSHHMHPAAVVAQVGIGSQAGSERIARRRLRRVVVSLGVNDDPSNVSTFAGSVHRVLRRRDCVVWLKVRGHDRFNAKLKAIRSRDGRLHLVRIAGVATVDGIHPTQHGYRLIAQRTRRQLRAC